MFFVCLSINYKNVSVELREQFVVQDNLIVSFNKNLINNGCFESLIVSTCNRTEYYLLSEKLENIDDIFKNVSECMSIGLEDLKSCAELFTGDEALSHLMRVACGIESLAIGETQVLGQVKSCFKKAREAESLGKFLNIVEMITLKTAKSVRSSTDINKKRISIPSLAVDKILKESNYNLSEKTVTVIGIGTISKLVLEYLLKSRPKRIYVVNRSVENIKKITDRLHPGITEILACGFESIETCISDSSYIISATSSDKFVVKNTHLQNINIDNKKFFIDLAIPSDIDPSIKNIHNIKLWNIDMLKKVVDKNYRKRVEESEKADYYIKHSLSQIKIIMAYKKYTPQIISLQREASREFQKDFDKVIENVSDEYALRKIERDLVNNQKRILNKKFETLKKDASVHQIKDINLII